MTDFLPAIVAFIRARIDEDEQYRQEQYEEAKGSPRRGGKSTITRGLRSVAWKRQLLDEFEGAAETRRNYLNIDPTSSEARSASGMYYGLRHAVKLLGSEWAGHTDYREDEWRP